MLHCHELSLSIVVIVSIIVLVVTVTQERFDWLHIVAATHYACDWIISVGLFLTLLSSMRDLTRIDGSTPGF